MPDPAPRKAPIAFAPDTLAFPTNSPVYVSAGLTKREYCAAMAMQGQMANAEILVRYGLYAADIARAAVAQAERAVEAQYDAEAAPVEDHGLSARDFA